MLSRCLEPGALGSLPLESTCSYVTMSGYVDYCHNTQGRPLVP